MIKLKLCFNEMFHTNFRSNSKIVKHISNYFNLSFPISYKQWDKKYFCTVTNKFYNNSIFKSSSLHYLSYGSLAQEIPPPNTEEKLDQSDTFGDLGGLKFEKVELDEEELKEEEKQKNLYSQVPRKFKPTLGEYSKIIKNYTLKGDVKAAEEVIKYCIFNKDQPTPYMYSLLINEFALRGDLLKCYKYFSDMKSRHYKIKNNIYTSLFNACANSHDTDRALKYLDKIREYMKKKNIPLHYAHYNVLIKAYGRHGDFRRSEKLAQHMINLNMKIGITTLNSLMYAANTDTKSGLKHIFSIWQFMRQQKIPPDIFTYNLLLRGIQHTQFGNFTVNDLLSAKHTGYLIDKPDLLNSPPAIGNLPFPGIQTKPTNNELIEPPVFHQLLNINNESIDSNISESQKDTLNQVLPSEIANMNLDAILKQNKLILFGGFMGVLEKMNKDKVAPNIKTLTYLMELLPNSVAAEDSLIKYANSHGIKPDLTFFNCLIKKRCSRADRKHAKEVINYIHKADLKPNIMTYGVLALACETSNELYELLTTMKSTGCTINKYIAQPLLVSAMKKFNFPFIFLIMEKLKKERVHVDDELFTVFDTFQQKLTNLVKTKDKSSTTEKFKTGFSKFNMRYKTWQQEMGRKILIERK